MNKNMIAIVASLCATSLCSTNAHATTFVEINQEWLVSGEITYFSSSTVDAFNGPFDFLCANCGSGGLSINIETSGTISEGSSIVYSDVLGNLAHYYNGRLYSEYGSCNLYDCDVFMAQPNFFNGYNSINFAISGRNVQSQEIWTFQNDIRTNAGDVLNFVGYAYYHSADILTYNDNGIISDIAIIHEP
jgi:hypothetical protein